MENLGTLGHKYAFYPMCFLSPSKTGENFESKLQKPTLALALGNIPQKEVITYVDKNKDIGIVIAPGQVHDRFFTMIIINNTDVFNGHYFKELTKTYPESKEKIKIEEKDIENGKRVEVNSILIPTFDTGALSNIKDLISNKSSKEWDKIEKKVMNNKGYGVQGPTRKKVEINFVSTLAHGDIFKIIKDALNPGPLSKWITEETGYAPNEGIHVLLPNGVKPEETPFAVVIIEYKKTKSAKFKIGFSPKDTLKIVVLIERDRFKDEAKKLLDGSQDIPIPIDDVGNIISNKEIAKAVEEAEHLIYKQLKYDLRILEKESKKEIKNKIRALYMPAKKK